MDKNKRALIKFPKALEYVFWPIDDPLCWLFQIPNTQHKNQALKLLGAFSLVLSKFN